MLKFYLLMNLVFLLLFLVTTIKSASVEYHPRRFYC